jgi:hypothetical protein
VSFLENALKCIGVNAAPRLDLGFAGSKDFSFAFTDVTYESVDPAQLDRLIGGMATEGIPVEYVDAGHLHVAYEYAYAGELIMTRGDKQSFSGDISGKVGDFLDLGTQGSVTVASNSAISFKSADAARAAFAYKAGRLALQAGRWAFYPEEVATRGLVEERAGYLPQPAIVLPVDGA